jgi:hypothetical protein
VTQLQPTLKNPHFQLLLLQAVYEIRYRLPKDFTCDRCVLQWHYLTGNSCW